MTPDTYWTEWLDAFARGDRPAMRAAMCLMAQATVPGLGREAA